MDPKPGVQTSEFKIALLALVLGGALMALAVYSPPERDAMASKMFDAGQSLATAAAGMYTLSRVLVKR